MFPGAVITIGIDPEIHLGPVDLAWHGLTIAIGVGVGLLVAARWSRSRGLDPGPLFDLMPLLVLGGIIGGRVFYVIEEGGPLIGTRGFTFAGGLILAGLLLAIEARRRRLDLRYLDVIALWLPLGVAIGRIGDVINGEHYGSASTAFYAVRNTHPDALTPNPDIAYENGGLFEVSLALLVLAAMLVLRRHLRRPGDLAWAVVGLFALGRFFEFFVRSDSPDLALGLSNAQWTSAVLLIAVVIGRFVLSSPADRRPPTGQAP